MGESFKIVADKNIPLVKEMYSSVGELSVLDGHSITAEVVRDADILLVRSVTPVDRKLLEGSRIRFVGTATIGTDHIDVQYLDERGIRFASAPGSNSRSVAEYVLAGLLTLGERMNFSLREKTLGIIGIGNVGTKVAGLAHAMGMNVLLNDPPLARIAADPSIYVPLDRIMEADIVTLHVPLTTKGPDATVHLFDHSRISKMKRGSILVNSSRGKVVETEGLKRAMTEGDLAACILDVWEHEPGIDVELLTKTTLGTPHIAGYSFDGKINGAEMIYREVCRCVGLTPKWDRSCIGQDVPVRKIVPESFEGASDPVVRSIVRQCYDIEHDDRRLREMIVLPEVERKAHFTGLRATYPVRREFHAATIVVPQRYSSHAALLSSLGFSIESANKRI